MTNEIMTTDDGEIHEMAPHEPTVTPAQARVDAVAALTMSAYANASMLKLTPEETKALQADFEDSAFRGGAGGKESLIYLEHPYIRDRLNEVLGIGQWSIVPRSRWTENFTTSQGKPGVKVYVEGMLVVRGCFVDEAVGDMDYYPSNPATNLGDAVKGAKSQILRRTAADGLGVGLQAWKKGWCEQWWLRKQGKVPPHQKPNGQPPPVEVKEESTLWKEWDSVLNPEIVNETRLNNEVIAAFKAVPGNHPERGRIWKRIKDFAAGFDMYMDHSTKKFVKKIDDGKEIGEMQ